MNLKMNYLTLFSFIKIIFLAHHLILAVNPKGFFLLEDVLNDVTDLIYQKDVLKSPGVKDIASGSNVNSAVLLAPEYNSSNVLCNYIITSSSILNNPRFQNDEIVVESTGGIHLEDFKTYHFVRQEVGSPNHISLSSSKIHENGQLSFKSRVSSTFNFLDFEDSVIYQYQNGRWNQLEKIEGKFSLKVSIEDGRILIADLREATEILRPHDVEEKLPHLKSSSCLADSHGIEWYSELVGHQFLISQFFEKPNLTAIILRIRSEDETLSYIITTSSTLDTPQQKGNVLLVRPKRTSSTITSEANKWPCAVDTTKDNEFILMIYNEATTKIDIKTQPTNEFLEFRGLKDAVLYECQRPKSLKMTIKHDYSFRLKNDGNGQVLMEDIPLSQKDIYKQRVARYSKRLADIGFADASNHVN